MLLANYSGCELEVGCDEAGRGCLAGPVFAAAVILPKDVFIEGLNDSKQLSEINRDKIVPLIKQHALAYSISFCTVEEIDTINILNASIKAMHKALNQLSKQPEFILIDGNRFKKYQNLPHKTIIHGDAIYMSIAAASILAKTSRDAYMKELHLRFPEYGWHKNKGYGTLEHRKAIAQHGQCMHHRKSFRLLPDQPTLF